MKKNPLITVYSILVILIFAGTIAFSGFSLVSEYKGGKITEGTKFNLITNEVRQSVRAKKNPDFNKIFAERGLSTKDFAYINVKINKSDVLLYPSGAAEPVDNNKFSKVRRETFAVGDYTVYVCANIYLLSPAVISYYCKVSFIIILIFTILTILLIVIKSISEKDELEEKTEDGFDLDSEIMEEVKAEEEKTSETSDEKKDEDTPAVSDKSEETETKEEKAETNYDTLDVSEYEEAIVLPVDFPPEEKVEKQEEIPAEETSEESEETKEAETEETPVVEEKKEVSEEKTEQADLPVEDYIPESNNPVGLYSELTGFGWEQYLTPRLENELVRATSSEFDLCLFVIKIKDFAKNPDEIKKVSEILLSYFQFKDMVFEYKDDGYAAIKTNINIDEAIKLADNMYAELSEVLKPADAKCYIGLSSKTIRMVSAERILKEADAAVEHAQEDAECPIIAFRANAEKYMEFVEKN